MIRAPAAVSEASEAAGALLDRLKAFLPQVTAAAQPNLPVAKAKELQMAAANSELAGLGEEERAGRSLDPQLDLEEAEAEEEVGPTFPFHVTCTDCRI